MNLAECLQPENFIFGLEVSSKEHLLRLLAERAAKATGADKELVLAALTNREKLGSTGVGRGVAVPHAPVAGINKPFGLLARLKKPVDFEAIDEEPVDIVFLALSPIDQPSSSLKMLASAARLLRGEEVLLAIRSARNLSQLYDAMQAGET